MLLRLSASNECDACSVLGNIVFALVLIREDGGGSFASSSQHNLFAAMPSLRVIQREIAKLPQGPPLVIVISGGTTGIGSYIAKELARLFASKGSKLRVYIVGRNITRAEKVLAEGRYLSPGSEWRFVKATDLALISEVDRCCADIIKQETDAPFHGGPVRLDALYMTHARSPLVNREMTEEGLDSFLSTLYYSRIRMTMNLIPLLSASPLNGHVISVYAGSFEEVKAGDEPPIGCPPDDAYGVSTVRRNTVYMKNFAFEELASRHAGRVSFAHIYPGLVDGPAFTDPGNPLWFRVIWRLLYPLLWLTYMTSAEDCGKVMLYLSTPRFPAKGVKQEGIEPAMGTDGKLGSGSYALGQRADPSKVRSFDKVRPEGVGERIWAHTMETFERIVRKNKPQGSETEIQAGSWETEIS
ncbi:uncharacterized protein PV09_01403 [Verruconis gallopava]|uniref:Ketoreductase (KR) domain-containing protein n=1 Tax=Verruconis gallopava TaxID=253628 RepID=A0A0D2BB81_9PEZI|nr:uncharacterized protein PV09_01403 [Verruconis gallopava]KIW08509.1 hypothetical protein PV09_01403 [Verruconis gallopava]